MKFKVVNFAKHLGRLEDGTEKKIMSVRLERCDPHQRPFHYTGSVEIAGDELSSELTFEVGDVVNVTIAKETA